MNRMKISFFALGLASGILAGYFFAQWQYRLGIPHAVSPCDQSATTTDCLKLLTKLQPGTTPPPTYPERPETATATPFTFSPLTNTYEDKEFGFSLKYPDEVQIYPSTATECRLLNDKRTDGGYFAIRICNPKMVMGFRNPLAHSLDDYQYDYFLTQEDFERFTRGALDLPPFSDTTKMRIHIKKSDDITTLSGIKGLKQVYTIEYFNTKSSISIQERAGEMIDHLRYVFYHPQKGAIAMSVLRPYPTLEDAIIQSVSY